MFRFNVVIIFLDSFHSHPDLGTRQPPCTSSPARGPVPLTRPGVQHDTRTQRRDMRRDLGDRAHPCSAFPQLPRQPLACVLAVLVGGCMGAFLQPLFLAVRFPSPFVSQALYMLIYSSPYSCGTGGNFSSLQTSTEA